MCLKNKMYEKISEGKAVFYVPSEKKVSKKLPVFYNPMMKLNRDVCVALLESVKDEGLLVGLPLAGTGIRGIRFLVELTNGKIRSVRFNDQSEDAVKLIKRNIRLNKGSFTCEEVSVSCADASEFMLSHHGFSYIDIDPFGSPNPFLDSAVKRIARGGILGVTATDTAALAGTFPNACIRKYWAKPMRNELKHEAGLRILIRKVQLIGMHLNKALTPIYSYSADHYMRVFFRCEKGKQKCDAIAKQFGMLGEKEKEAGPMWLGKLWDSRLAAKIAKKVDDFRIRGIEDRLCRIL